MTSTLFYRTHLGRIPTFGGQVLDLYALYNIVTSFGGISIVRLCKIIEGLITAESVLLFLNNLVHHFVFKSLKTNHLGVILSLFLYTKSKLLLGNRQEEMGSGFCCTWISPMH